MFWVWGVCGVFGCFGVFWGVCGCFGVFVVFWGFGVFVVFWVFVVFLGFGVFSGIRGDYCSHSVKLLLLWLLLFLLLWCE